MKRTLTLSLLSVLILSVVPVQIQAQRHLYKRVEIGFANGWMSVAGTALSAIVNTSINYPLVDSQIRFSGTSSDGGLKNYEGIIDEETVYDEYGQAVSNGDYFKFDSRHLFNHIMAGGKIGYLTDKRGFLNYCVFGSLHYNLRQFQEENYDINHNTQRIQAGGGVMVVMGSIEHSTRFILEGGLRYNIPLHYGNSEGWGETSMLDTGLSSHYQAKVSFSNAFAIGLQFDCMHYNLFKDTDIVGEKNKIYEGGLVVTLLF